MRNIAFILITFALLAGCTKIAEDEGAKDDKEYPDQESWSAEIILTQEGQKKAVIHAGHLLRYNNRAEVLMDDTVEVDFFNVEGEHVSHLKSLRARVNENDNNLLASGNVVVEADRSVTLFTEELRWDQQRERIISDVDITLVTEQDTLTGVGFESDSNLENWSTRNPSGVTDRETEEK